jgi:hypothetical protein
LIKVGLSDAKTSPRETRVAFSVQQINWNWTALKVHSRKWMEFDKLKSIIKVVLRVNDNLVQEN